MDTTLYAKKDDRILQENEFLCNRNYGHHNSGDTNAQTPLMHMQLLEKSKEIGVHHIQSTISLTLLDNARDVDLAGTCKSCQRCFRSLGACLGLTLRDHLNVDVVVAQHAEETTGNAYHVLELLADETNDGHVRHNVDGTQGT